MNATSSTATRPDDAVLGAPPASFLQAQLPLWTLVKSPLPDNPVVTREELFRELRFKSFLEAIGFMTLVAPGCDALDHHPRWENTYRIVRVYLSTWDAGLHAVSDRDTRLAEYMDQMYAAFPGRGEPDEPKVGCAPS
jgi:pterin-4a-carbinolamine dehydratase